eukprot:TRINITY_DN6515_c0_g1_i1.p1 TRINITY_DN6515_c0_g1~~TRINITY_DN6515_c0_g1_i1.p1  ORF type:complete len:882 (-),score=125.38 TRINITY_DN6515_c0_g1_i1:189-2756(-)
MENCYSTILVQTYVRVRASQNGIFKAPLDQILWELQNLSSTKAHNITDVQTPSQRAANVEELESALTVNLLIFLCGFLLWISSHCFSRSSAAVGDRVERSTKASEVPKRNYLSFLFLSGFTFAVLCLVNVLFLVWHKVLSSIVLEGHSLFFIFEKIPHTEIFSLTLVDGFIVLFFTELLHSLIIAPPAMDDQERLRRTVWFQGLPTHDNMRWWKPFRLNDSDLIRVRRDFSDALTDFLVAHEKQDSSSSHRTQQEQGSRSTFTGPSCDSIPSLDGTDHGESSHVEEVQIAVVVDEWARIQAELTEIKETTDTYLMKQEATLRDLKAVSKLQCLHRAVCSPVTCWYDIHIGNLMRRTELLEKQLEEISKGSKMLTGSAFVTFKDPSHSQVFLQEFGGLCWNFQSCSYFNFGRPPFASVTLTCERAPHCSDIVWQNLHVPLWRRRLFFWILSALLFVVMFVLVTAVGITGFVKPILEFVGRRGENWVPGFITPATHDFGKMRYWNTLLTEVPTMGLLFINSVFLPVIIQRISTWERSPLFSFTERRLLFLNFLFLFLNTIVVPSFGVATLNELLGVILSSLNEEIDLVQHLRFLLLNSPGIFMMKYLMNAICLSNMNEILQVSQNIYRFCRSIFLDVTPRDRQKTAMPWTFHWGYWYAWSLSVFAIGITMSIPCPGSLALVSVFFLVRYAVDKRNLDTGVYTLNTDIEGCLAVRVVRYLRVIVGLWWFMMGLCAYVGKMFGLVAVATPDGKQQMPQAGLSLMVLGVVTMLVSWALTARELSELKIQGLSTHNKRVKPPWDPLGGIRKSLQRGGPFSGTKENVKTEVKYCGDSVVIWDGTQLLGLSPPKQQNIAGGGN